MQSQGHQLAAVIGALAHVGQPAPEHRPPAPPPPPQPFRAKHLSEQRVLLDHHNDEQMRARSTPLGTTPRAQAARAALLRVLDHRQSDEYQGLLARQDRQARGRPVHGPGGLHHRGGTGSEALDAVTSHTPHTVRGAPEKRRLRDLYTSMGAKR